MADAVDKPYTVNATTRLSASTGGANPPENPYVDFQAGVTAALRAWSALRMAVDQSWGGTESAAKAEDLRSNIFAFFDGTSRNPLMSMEELEDNLLEYMEEEFGVVLEDGSERELADLIWRMYAMCAGGDATLAREVVRNATRGGDMIMRSGIKSMIRSGDGNDDDDMEDDSDVEGEAINSTGGQNVGQEHQQLQTMYDSKKCVASVYASGALFGGPTKPKKELPPPRQLGKPHPERLRPEVDTDGFAMVMTKKKSKKR